MIYEILHELKWAKCEKKWAKYFVTIFLFTISTPYLNPVPEWHHLLDGPEVYTAYVYTYWSTEPGYLEKG